MAANQDIAYQCLAGSKGAPEPAQGPPCSHARGRGERQAEPGYVGRGLARRPLQSQPANSLRQSRRALRADPHRKNPAKKISLSRTGRPSGRRNAPWLTPSRLGRRRSGWL
jgi:hypothetical protein